MPGKKRRLFDYLGDVARSTVFPRDMVSSRPSFVLVYFIRLMFLVGRRLWHDRCPRQAAALSYQTFLSLIPVLAIALAVASTLDLDPIIEKAMAYLQAQLLPEAAADVGMRIRDLVSSIKPKTLTIVGTGTLVLISLSLLFSVEQVTNEIFRCDVARRIWLRVITSLLLLMLAPLAIGLSMYYTTRLFFLPRVATAMFPLLFTVVALFLAYWLLPHRKIQIRHSLISAFVAGSMFEAVKMGFAMYARYLGGTMSYLYGTMAILPLFMIWVYLAWLIFLFGAELNAALHEVRRHDRFELD
jgi:membrane protein